MRLWAENWCSIKNPKNFISKTKLKIWSSFLMQKITSYLQFHLHEVMLEYSTPTWATVIAGAFVLLTLTLSIYLLFEHLSAYKDPEVYIYVRERARKYLCIVWIRLLLFTNFDFVLVIGVTGAKVFDRCYTDGPVLCNWICKFDWLRSWFG